MSAPRLPDRTSSAYAARRPPAHLSVSLLHNSSSLKDHALAAPKSDIANPPSSSSDDNSRPGKVKQAQHSSGESSDAGKWFEKSNNNARQTAQVDNDPPFFLRNSSSSDTPPDRVAPPMPFGHMMPQHRDLSLPLMPTDGSSADEFRSVIDDLTIANKKLKKRLKKYEKLYDPHLPDDKLFEVRYHTLPEEKKKELEELMKKFVLNIDEVPGASQTARTDFATVGTAASGYQQYAPLLKPRATNTSSHTSRVAESGYYSMSGQGNGGASSMQGAGTSSAQGASSAQSAQGSAHQQKQEKALFSRQQADIHTYIRDIPAGLLPNGNTLAMTEKSRKKLVVRRLEQIFAGKGAATSGHQQPQQQQEVAQSAAQADRRANEATGKVSREEGVREAKIMPQDLEDDMEIESDAAMNHHVASTKIAEQDFAGFASPDQRPTRPLDLDPHRAQIPLENMDYIRHLGFTPPDMQRSPIDDHGWIYLNLIINMAQLHTINVTVDFVKKAVTEYSDHLELSPDGRKIRWAGGESVTRNISDASTPSQGGLSPEETRTKANGKRLKSGAGTAEDAKRLARKMALWEKEKEMNKLAYTPLFFRKEESETEESSMLDPSSYSSPAPAQQSSGFASSGNRTNSTKRKHDNGPMIFYNKSKFMTDLSGNRRLPGDSGQMSSYNAFTQHPIGHGASRDDSFEERRDPAESLSQMYTEEDIEMEDSSASTSDIAFSVPSLEENIAGTDRFAPFEVSGLGGVHPEDHFSINVVSRQTRRPRTSPHDSKRRTIPPRMNKVLATQAASTKFEQTITRIPISTKTNTLPASALPAPSFLPFHSSSGDESDDESSASTSGSDSDVSISSTHAQPTVLRQPMFNIRDSSSSRAQSSNADSSDLDSEMSEDGDGGDDGAASQSVDFLATARMIDPDTIRLREREYDADMAERLAEEIPAGSSAATAGGGSGFNSPAEAQKSAAVLAASEKEDYEMGKKRERGASLKRARTSDSMAVMGAPPKLRGKGRETGSTQNSKMEATKEKSSSGEDRSISS